MLFMPMIAAAALAAVFASSVRPASAAACSMALITGPVPTALAAATNVPHFCWLVRLVSDSSEERLRLRSRA